MSQVFHLLYTSMATTDVTRQLIQSILKSARQHNSADNITGFLIARDNYFLQLLEGDEAKVKACLKRIEKDARHTDVVIHGEVNSDQRIMPDWSMAEVTWVPTMASSESLVEIFELGRAGQFYKRRDSLLSILKKFSTEAKAVA